MIILATILLAQSFCHNPDGSCYPVNPIMPCTGTVNSTPCPVTPTPTPTPTFQETSIKWLPPLTNYIESPWIMRHQDAVYIGGHAGYCCMDYRPDGGRGFDVAWVIRYGNTSVVSNYLTLQYSAENDDHEVGGYYPLIVGDKWWMFGSRTERSDWGKGNRLRPMQVETKDPITKQWTVRRDPPLYYPLDPACKDVGSCEGIGNSQNGSALMLSDGRILVMSKDDVGTTRSTSMHLVYEIDRATGNGKYLYTSSFGMDGSQSYKPSFSDWGLAPDGSILAYTGDQPVSNWYKSSSVVEWKSLDVGKTFWKTGRTWKSSTAQCLWDIGVMKNGEGLIVQPLTLIGIASDKCEFATVQSAWYLWVMSENLAGLTKTFGMIPQGPPPPTYHITGLEDVNNAPMVIEYTTQSNYCIYVHHDSGPWLGRDSVFCAYGGTPGQKFTETYMSLKGCGLSPCPVPPHKFSFSGWGIYDVSIYKQPRPVRPSIP